MLSLSCETELSEKTYLNSLLTCEGLINDALSCGDPSYFDHLLLPPEGYHGSYADYTNEMLALIEPYLASYFDKLSEIKYKDDKEKEEKKSSKLLPIIENTPAKLLDLGWDRLATDDVFILPSLIQIDAFNRDGIIFDIMDYIGAHHISLKSFNTTLLEEKNRVVFHCLCMMKSQDHFLSFKEELLFELLSISFFSKFQRRGTPD